MDDQEPTTITLIYTYDRRGRLQSLARAAVEEARDREARLASRDESRSFRCEHDPAARVFRVVAADGTVETFRDRPTKYLCVAPDPETGAMRPVRKRGRPLYVYLCREVGEPR